MQAHFQPRESRGLRVVSTTLLSLAAALAGCRDQDPVSPSYRDARPSSPPHFEQSACPIEFPPPLKVDCGVLTVPENRVKDNGRTIRLPVAIVRARSSSPAPDPIVFVTGGPATNEIDRFLAQFFASLPFAANRDFILYNQRGVGFADPRLGCPEFDRALATAFPADPTWSQALAAVAQCRDRLAGQGIELEAYNSAEDAADLRDLRVGLGYAEWNMYVVSAGGIIGLTAMRLYPEGIRSVILDSPLGNMYEIVTDLQRAHIRLLEMIFARCAANTACEAAYPNLRTRFYDRVHALRVQPVVLSIPVEGGGSRSLTVDGDVLLGESSACEDPFCALDMPARLDLVARGDVAGFFDFTFSLNGPNDPFVAEGKKGVSHCHDSFAFEHTSDLQQAARESPEFRSLLLNRLPLIPDKWNTKEACKAWQVGRAEPAQHRLVTSTIPTLILSGEWDGAVSPVHAQEIASTLSRSFFVEFQGIGHWTLIWLLITGTDCPARIAAEFIGSPTTGPNSACATALPEPDFTPPSFAESNRFAPRQDPSMDRWLLPLTGRSRAGPILNRRK
jgi:pimeloyl-ACP methyl ester carboxylesterase